jgi:hypothetical protein
MARRSDGPPTISEERLCEIAGVNRTTRRKWAKRGLLRARKSGYEESDAVELSILNRLSTTLGPFDAAVAWRQIRDEVGNQEGSAKIDLVFDTQYKHALLTTGLARLGPKLRHGRPVRVISLNDAIEEIRQAFERLVMFSD